MYDSTDVFSLALALPNDQRADLAQRLLLSLEPDEPDPDAAPLHPSWRQEILARSEAFRRGELDARDWRSSIQDARRRLSEIYDQGQAKP